MTITALAFVNAGVDLATDADLREFHPDMSNNIWTGRENYRSVLSSAFDQALFDVTQGEFSDSTLISNSADNIAWFRRVVCYLALVRIFRDFRAQSGDRWDMLVSDYQKLYDQAIGNPVLDYDTDESGTVDDEEEGTKSSPELVR